MNGTCSYWPPRTFFKFHCLLMDFTSLYQYNNTSFPNAEKRDRAILEYHIMYNERLPRKCRLHYFQQRSVLVFNLLHCQKLPRHDFQIRRFFWTVHTSSANYYLKMMLGTGLRLYIQIPRRSFMEQIMGITKLRITFPKANFIINNA